jgi:hypothetical protein
MYEWPANYSAFMPMLDPEIGRHIFELATVPVLRVLR